MSAIDTIPAVGEQATTETLPWGFDFTNLLQQGETLSSPTVQFIRNTDGASAGNLTPALSGNIVIVPVVGSLLKAGVGYDLYVSAQAATGKIWTMHWHLQCPAI